MGFLKNNPKISVFYRVLIVLSICWVILVLANNDWEEFLLFGILPVIFLWGIFWIRNGFKERSILKKGKKYLKIPDFLKPHEEFSPEIISSLINIERAAESSGKNFRDFLFEIGFTIKEAESLDDLYKRYKLSNPINLSIESSGPVKHIKNSDQKPYNCPICGTIIIKENGKKDLNNISVCYDCYYKKYLQPEKIDKQKKTGHFILY